MKADLAFLNLSQLKLWVDFGNLQGAQYIKIYRMIKHWNLLQVDNPKILLQYYDINGYKNIFDSLINKIISWIQNIKKLHTN